MKKSFKIWNLPEAKIYLAIILFLVIILLQFDYWIGGLAFVLFLFLLYYNRRMVRQRGEEWDNYLESLSEDIDWGTKNAVSSIPMPLAVIETGGSITWYNPLFGEMFQGEKLLGRNIHDFVPELVPAKFKPNKDGDMQELFFQDRWYRLNWTPVKTGNNKGKTIFLIYWLDITEEYRIKELYKAKKIVFAHMIVDNYDEVLANTESTKRPAVVAEIESRIAHWADSINAGWIKYDSEKYLVVMEEKELAQVREKKFDVLDQIREINEGNKISPTLSIGVGMGEDNPAQSTTSALSALELALGRGGDQAVVKKGTRLYFYGGKARA